MTSEADAPKEGLGEVYKGNVRETQQRGTTAETVVGQDAGPIPRDASHCRLESVEPQHDCSMLTLNRSSQAAPKLCSQLGSKESHAREAVGSKSGDT